MQTHLSTVMGIVMGAMAAAAGAGEGQAVTALRAEGARLRAELVLLEHIRFAQRELIEWERLSEEGPVKGLPQAICEASALKGLCAELHLTFSGEEDAW